MIQSTLTIKQYGEYIEEGNILTTHAKISNGMIAIKVKQDKADILKANPKAKFVVKGIGEVYKGNYSLYVTELELIESNDYLLENKLLNLQDELNKKSLELENTRKRMDDAVNQLNAIDVKKRSNTKKIIKQELIKVSSLLKEV